jgi:hypothetical protein
MSVCRMFFFEDVTDDNIVTNEYSITGSTYEPVGDVLKDGAKVDCSKVIFTIRRTMLKIVIIDYHIMKV